MTSAISMTMVQFQRLATSVSAKRTVVVRGRHGIGKSESVYQIAAKHRSDFYKDPKNCAKMCAALFPGQNKKWTYDMGLPVVERRLSQMTEGDMIGLPELVDGRTTFRACDWLVNACEYPCVLFLDERNRALEAVKQSVFELQDSRKFYGRHLHSETRLFIAENIGDQYSVNSVDPAEISRAAVVDLNPSNEDWLIWAEKVGNIHALTREYIAVNPSDLEFNGACEANAKYPDRRAWAMLDQELQTLGLFANPEDELFVHVAGAFIGPATGMKFWAHCKSAVKDVSAEEILTNWNKAKKTAKLQIDDQERMVAFTTRVVEWLKDNKLTDSQAGEFKKFFEDCAVEMRMVLFRGLHKPEDTTNHNIKTATAKIAPLIHEMAKDPEQINAAVQRIEEKQKALLEKEAAKKAEEAK